MWLFADAELGEDVVEDFVGGDLAGDGAKVVEDLAEVFAQQVGGKAFVEGLQGAAKGVAGLAERLGVAAVRDDGVASVQPRRVDRQAQTAEQFVDARAVFRGDADGVLWHSEVGRGVVDLVHDRQIAAVGLRGGRDRFGGVRAGGVLNMQDDAGPLDGLPGAFDAHLFQPVVGLVQAGRVDEAEEHAVDVHALLDRIAGRAGDLGDHCPLVAHQSVQQGALPDIGAADEDDGHPLFQGVAQREALVQAGELAFDPLHLAAERSAIGELDVLLGEVELQFEQGDQAQQPLAQRAELLGIGSADLGGCQGVCGPGLGGDHVGDGLRLGEVHASGQKGAGGELAGGGHAGPLPDAEVEYALQDVAGAVAGELDGVVARIGVRGAEHGGDDVVHCLGTVEDGAVAERVPRSLFQRSQPAEDAVAELDGALSADADHAQGTAGGCSGGDDDIVRVDHRSSG